MHKCVRCSRVAGSLEEINTGCPCGSKIFVFNRDAAALPEMETAVPAVAEKIDAAPAIAGNFDGTPGQTSDKNRGDAPSNNGGPATANKDAADSQAAAAQATKPEEKNESDGRAPQSNFARTTFTSEDVENIKIVSDGVFLVDVKGLSKSPIVLKDEEGVYYVKLPGNGGNGKNADGKKKESDSNI